MSANRQESRAASDRVCPGWPLALYCGQGHIAWHAVGDRFRMLLAGAQLPGGAQSFPHAVSGNPGVLQTSEPASALNA